MFRNTIRAGLAAAALTLSAAAAMAAPAHLSHGAFVDERGMTLYTFDKDSAGVSNCMMGCAIAWPPYYAPAGATASGKWTLAKHGMRNQWAYNGHPVYFYAHDKKPGDKTGDGVGGVWHVAR